MSNEAEQNNAEHTCDLSFTDGRAKNEGTWRQDTVIGMVKHSIDYGWIRDEYRQKTIQTYSYHHWEETL